eukprot:s2422_g11.t1
MALIAYHRLGYDPLKLVPLEEDWMPYFQKLEAQDLPNLFELEDSFRLTQPDKATGFDEVASESFRRCAPQLAQMLFSITAKIFLWQHEPLFNKGGPMAVLHKNGNHVDVQNYRGVMLTPTFAKRIHPLLRTRLMQLLESSHPPGQIGGFANQQVLFGSLAMQAFGRIADHFNFSFPGLSECFPSVG